MGRDDVTFPVSYPVGFWARTAAVSAVACAGGLVLLEWVFSRELGTEFAPAFYAMKGVLSFLAPALVFCLLAVLLVASTAVLAVAVLASHKVAGPLFRLQRVAGYLGRRVLPGRIHLRMGDQGKPVAAEINAWVAGRKERLAEFQERTGACEEALRRAEESLGRGGAGESGEALADLQRLGEQFREKRHERP